MVMLVVAVMVLRLLGHPCSHKSFGVGDGASLLAARTTAHIDGMIAHFATSAAEVLMCVRIRRDGSLSLKQGDPILYSTCARLLDSLVGTIALFCQVRVFSTSCCCSDQ